LGVLLYELLTGTTPFSRKRLQQAAFDEMLRIIREEEPPRPSTRLSTTDELPSIAANRSLEPKKLSGAVKGELDWIVMKCLEKAREYARQALDEMSSEMIEDWLGRQNELTPDQQQFLKRALESYQRFTEETGDSPEQQRALAAAHYRVATIHHRLGRSVEAQA